MIYILNILIYNIFLKFGEFKTIYLVKLKMYPNLSIKYKIIQIILFKRLSINCFNKKMIFYINLNIKVIYFY